MASSWVSARFSFTARQERLLLRSLGFCTIGITGFVQRAEISSLRANRRRHQRPPMPSLQAPSNERCLALTTWWNGSWGIMFLAIAMWNFHHPVGTANRMVNKEGGTFVVFFVRGVVNGGGCGLMRNSMSCRTGNGSTGHAASTLSKVAG